ncbi:MULTISPECIES: hypothetical protein [Bacillales]|uniref:hypothetical protein n=1 Tax=Bacillales TaxID=1385 RepID=UPI001F3EE8C2|nr:hypothetical protein [Staphylococcus aureus]WAI26793.1 MAG: hypothetical protein NRZ50_28245 [Bacillus paranthracis]WAI29740.1 MAG: hypothetical protein NRZ50_28815 [Bacillus paranthracis]WAI30240.1 MAG: hypothetical protein NRZ52_15075 [Bacillus paranthracis]WAI35442.1 MAG: hypothetical protein NRZ52_29550 [Bacillus paranthracis]WAI36473.1 MAG: hypothetical protein NRZ51_17500 [Bacillus paranthracis]
MKNKIGKPKKYSLQELKQHLLNYVQRHPNKTISYIGLERETGISRNTWSRNLKDEIAKLNEPIPFTTKIDFDTGIPLPNIFDIVEKNYDNKEKLISSLTHLNACINSLYAIAKKEQTFESENVEFKVKIKELEQTLREKDGEIKELKQQVIHYSQAYRNICVSSTYGEKGLKNVLEFKTGSEKNEEKISADLSKQFKMFDFE